MKKSVLKKLSPICLIGLVCVIWLFTNQMSSVGASDSPYFLTVDGTTPVTSIDLNGEAVTLQLATDDKNLGDTYQMVWNTSNVQYSNAESVNNIQVPGAKGDTAYKFTPVKPGVDEVFVNVYKGDPSNTVPIYVLSCKINSRLYNNDNYEIMKTYEGTKYLLLNQLSTSNDIYKSILFNKKPLSDTANSGALTSVTWISDNGEVINVDNNSAKVAGAGTATVTANAPGEIKVPIKTLVKPAFSQYSDFSDNATYVDAISFISNLSTTELYTNASMGHLKWKVYDVDTNTKTDKVKIESEGKKTILNTSYAGKYDIYATVLDESLLSDSLTTTKSTFEPSTSTEKDAVLKNAYAKATITVPFMSSSNTQVVMGLDDTFDLYGRTNAPSDLGINSITIADESIIGYDATKKELYAKKEGSTTVKFQTALTYDEYGNKIMKTLEYQVSVTDGLSLNTTEAKMYKGATLDLVASQSDGVTWSSSDTSVVTVDSKGKVTAVSKGFAIVTASKKINGVVKKATCKITVLNAITGVTITPNKASIDIDEFVTLYAEVTPSDTLDEDVSIKWFSSDSSIASIEASEKGNKTVVVKGVGKGVATITAVDTKNVILGSALVTVNAGVEKITLSHSSVTTTLSAKTLQLIAYVSPDDASNKEVTWKSTDTKVATVDAKTGLVTYLTAGKTTIIATSTSNPEVTAMCNIEINVPVTGLTLDATKSIQVGKSEKLNFSVVPTNATNNGITWLSTNTSVATINTSGYVTGVSVGQAIIIARTVEGNYLQYCIVNVTSKPTGITLDQSDITLNKGSYQFLYATLTPANASENTITWSSTDTSVATVTQGGKVTAVAAGSTLIFAKDASGNSAYCKVTVVESVEGIKLNFNKKTLKKGNSFKLKATFTPTTATNKSITWSSSNKSVASVSKDGMVKGVKGGVAIITAKSVDGKHVDTCIVTVKESVTKIVLNKTSYKLGKGKSYTLKASVKNSTASNKTVKWKSSNTKVATVNSKGKVTGKSIGYATITATATDGSKVSASCEIRVVNQVTSIKLNKSAVTLVEGRFTKLKATISPKSATYKTAKWSSSDTSVARVNSDGTITALKEGTATITAAAKDNSGKKAYCFVNVIKAVPATSVSILNSDVMLAVGESATLQRVISPSNSTDSTKWYSDNKSIVTVNSSTGRIKAKKPGVATITCTAGGKSSTVKVTVIGLSRTSITLEQYSTYTLSVYGATSGIKWDVSDPEVCRVSNGKLTSARIGTTTVTATVNGKKLYCTVKVVPIR